MALFIVTTKNCSGISNTIKVENGMSVEVLIQNGSDPLSTLPGQQAIVQAFLSKYNIDIKKAAKLSSTYLDIKKK